MAVKTTVAEDWRWLSLDSDNIRKGLSAKDDGHKSGRDVRRMHVVTWTHVQRDSDKLLFWGKGKKLEELGGIKNGGDVPRFARDKRARQDHPYKQQVTHIYLARPERTRP